jgi:two-component system, chemotaxis family, protein-glutamate methylesterase/glutaminase
MTPSGKKIRLLVVDDSAFIRRAIIRMFQNHPEITVIDVAADGEMAIRRIKELNPDVVTLDIRMPVLDGLSALPRIMKECPTPVVMLSSLTERGGENTLKALELGAVDFIDKSAAGGAMDISSLARELTSKICIAAGVDVGKLRQQGGAEQPARSLATAARERETELVLIGTSTGGPPALQNVLSSLPESFPCPILIVQHMPLGFTASLAQRLDRLSAIAVKEAADGELLSAGTAYIAPAGFHLKIRRSGGALFAMLDTLPSDALHRPSVDVLFQSVAEICGKKTVAFVLTGMGKDGAHGAAAIKEAGGRIGVESEETCIVYGMPKAVLDSVAVDAIAPLGEVGDAILKMV